MERRVRRIFRVLPHEPRCQLCAAPFAGAASPVMRAIGKRPAASRTRVSASRASRSSPSTTAARRSTRASCSRTSEGRRPLPSGCRATAFRGLLDRFYAAASPGRLRHRRRCRQVRRRRGRGDVLSAHDGTAARRESGGGGRGPPLTQRAMRDPDGPWVPVRRGRPHRFRLGRGHRRRPHTRADRRRRRRQHRPPGLLGRARARSSYRVGRRTADLDNPSPSSSGTYEGRWHDRGLRTFVRLRGRRAGSASHDGVTGDVPPTVAGLPPEDQVLLRSRCVPGHRGARAWRWTGGAGHAG